jgi:hypothetical protein
MVETLVGVEGMVDSELETGRPVGTGVVHTIMWYQQEVGGGNGGSGMGAGIFIDNNGSLTLANCTVTANAALGGAGGNPKWNGIIGIDGAGSGGGVFNHSGTVGLLNTIISGNTAPDNGSDLNGAFTSSGFNLIGNSQGATGLSVNDYQNEDAKIGPLQDNGGSTLTCSLLQGSLAIGGGTSVGAPDIDQRGVPRPAGHCDIGAFQLGTLLTATIIWNNPTEIVYGTALGGNQLNAVVGVDGTFSYSPPAGTVLPAGDNQVLTVVFTPANLAQYTAATNSVAINVLKANQTISFASLPNRQIGDSPGLLSASASSGLPVSFSIVAGPATLTGNLLVLGSASGLVTVRATQLGDANFNAAPYVDRSFVLGTLPFPVIIQQPVSQVANPGDRITFNVGANNGPFTYQWRFNGQPIPGAIGDTLVLARVKASQAGPYDVIVSNPSGPIMSQVAVLTVNIVTGSPIIITQPQDQKLRVGENTTISVVANGATPNLFYQWYQGASGETNGLILGATNAIYTVLGLTANTSLWVNVRNSLGFADSDSAAITVFPAKAAKLRLQMFAGMPGLTIDGLQGTAYRIEYSTNQSAANWTKLIDLSLPSNPFTFYDSGAVNTTTRFYRVVAP